jgi:hypothetical protein
VGSHPRARETLNFDRTDADIWVFNEALKMEWVKRADAVFQMHLEAIWRNPGNRNDPDHYKWLASGETPTVYMQDAYPDVPKSVRYPLDEIVSTLLPRFTWHGKEREGDRYFTSTFCYALALGIFLAQYKTIEVHGVEMETDTEYRYQRDGVTFWMGIALGRGVCVKAFCNFFDFPLYGYEGEATLDNDEFDRRIAELAPQFETAKTKYQAVAQIAANQVQTYLEKYTDPQDVIDSLKAQVIEAYNLHVISGMIQENERYKAKRNAMLAESGAFAFSRQEFEMAARGIAQDHDKAQKEYNAVAVACGMMFEKTKVKNQARRKHALREFAGYARKYIEKAMYVGLAYGALQENARYLEVMDKFIKAAGGEKSEAVLLEAALPQGV